MKICILTQQRETMRKQIIIHSEKFNTYYNTGSQEDIHNIQATNCMLCTNYKETWRKWKWCVYSVYESSSVGTGQDVLAFRVKGKESTSRNLNLNKSWQIRLKWSISFFHLCSIKNLSSPVCSHCTLTGRRARWRPWVKPARTASPHSDECSTGWTERTHAHIVCLFPFPKHVDIVSSSWVFNKIKNTHTLPSSPMLKTVFSS